MYNSSKILRLSDYIKLLNCIFVKQTLTKSYISIFNDNFKRFNETHNHATRQTTRNSVTLPQPSTEYFVKYSVEYQSACIWNSMQQKLSIKMIEESTTSKVNDYLQHLDDFCRLTI